MKTKFEYIHFVKVAEKPKTTVWECRHNEVIDELYDEDNVLGVVKWYGPWRQYCFSQIALMGVFNASCLDDIAEFIRSLPRKSGKKPPRAGKGE